MLPSLPQDKANHIVYGAAIALAIYTLCLAVSYRYAAWAGMAAAVLVGVVKEGVDRWANLKAARAGLPPPHGVEFMDTLATAAGGAFVFVVGMLPSWLRSTTA